MNRESVKHSLARAFDRSRLNTLIEAIHWRIRGPHVRAINYHDVPHSMAGRFEEQIRYFSKHYTPVDLDGLRRVLRGDWRDPRPGLLITFDDGLRTHADVAAPILEKYGFCGWFMVPADFVSVPASEQARWAQAHQIRFSTEGLEGSRIALDENDLVKLARRHVIGCHTRSHRRLHADLAEDELVDEISNARRILERYMNEPIGVFAWVGGEEKSYSATAAEAIRAADFEFGFMTNSAAICRTTDPLQLQRSNIEADFPIELTRLVLSGFYDALYWRKRSRINRLARAVPNEPQKTPPSVSDRRTRSS